MVTVSITIPNALATEINAIAQGQGFANGKAMIVSYIRGVVRNSRGLKAIKNVREAAEAQSDIETGAIS